MAASAAIYMAMRHIHKDYPFECPQCGITASFKTQAELDEHLHMRHDPNRPWSTKLWQILDECWILTTNKDGTSHGIRNGTLVLWALFALSWLNILPSREIMTVIVGGQFGGAGLWILSEYLRSRF